MASRASAPLSAPAVTFSITACGTPAAASSSGVAIRESSSPRPPATRAWTKTFDVSSAHSRFQPASCRSCHGAGSAAVQPPTFVEAAVAVEVVLAVDLEDVLVIAPLI